MASNFIFETRDQRIERMHRDNPGRPIELCTMVVDRMWEKRRQFILDKIPDRFSDASMSDLGYMEKPIMDALDAVFLPPEKNETVGIIFSGSAGAGKTHAAYAVAKFLADLNPDMIAFMITYSQAMTTLKAEFANNSYDEMGSTWDRLNNESGMYEGLLILDDVSAQKLTDFEVDKLMMILENRFNSYLPFLITTNVKPENFKEVFGPRLASRLLGYCEVVPFEDRDKRLENSDYE